VKQQQQQKRLSSTHFYGAKEEDEEEAFNTQQPKIISQAKANDQNDEMEKPNRWQDEM